MKRLLATLCLTLTLFGALSASTLAAGFESKIEITNNIEKTGIDLTGKTFDVYRIFNATASVAGDGTAAIDYTLRNDYVNFFVGKDGVVADSKTERSEFEEQAENYIHKQHDAEAMAQLVKDLKEYIATEYLDPDENIGGTVISNGSKNQKMESEALAPGYYLVWDNTDIAGDQNASAISAGMLVSLPSKNNSGMGGFNTSTAINIKGSQPNIDKEIYHNDKNDWDTVGDHQIGDTVEFRITADMPYNIDAYDEYKYIITDTWSEGISFNGGTENIEIFTSADLNPASKVPGDNHDTTLDIDNRTFELKFDMKEIKELHPTLEQFYIRYKGTITDDAKIAGDYETNEVKLEFSNNPYNNTSTGEREDTVYSYTFELDVLKTDDNGNPLSGAKFALWVQPKDEGEEYQVFLKQDEKDPTTYIVQKTGEFTGDDGIIVTDVNGAFQIKGLDDGIAYKLREVEAPAGYSKAEDLKFEISPTYDGVVIKNIGTSNGLVTDEDNDLILETTIENTSSAVLPGTGGIGSTIFMFGGCSLMAAAAFMLISSRSKHS